MYSAKNALSQRRARNALRTYLLIEDLDNFRLMRGNSALGTITVFSRPTSPHVTWYTNSSIGVAWLHGGTIAVVSVFGEGSTFTVTIPMGKAHLDVGRIRAVDARTSTAVRPAAFVEEASRWLPAPLESNGPVEIAPGPAKVSRILWADDNADMRAYVSRLLGDRCDVQAVGDGEAALEAARADPPALILTDVMMPKLDGYGLLALRADPRLREIPVILLSARAGEESRIEGMAAGADDYLVKPFSGNELLARVGTALQLGRVRNEARAQFETLLNEAPLGCSWWMRISGSGRPTRRRRRFSVTSPI
jgi:CheY-like chemotaxis protein